MSEYLSYGKFLEDRLNFRKSGTTSGELFNLFDAPSHKFFKILFYFGSNNEDETNGNFSSGLLAPTWDVFNERTEMDATGITTGLKELKYYDYNSAWAYLKLNDENERAEKLERFVTLLSNINTYSPWYFTSVSGIDSALERKSVEDGKLDLSETKKLTITCMPDAFDNRIGTLLELYRDIVWSWSQKKEIVPANLRKFDMAIYIFESPIAYMHNSTDNLNIKSSSYTPSYKMLEFHDCEFSYNSIKSGWNEVNNTEGVTPTYSIEISYNDCYEESYNEILMRKIGDVIATDTYRAVTDNNGINVSNMKFESEAQKDDSAAMNEFKNRTTAAANAEFADNGLSFDEKNELYSLGNLEEGGRETKRVMEDKNAKVPGFIENAKGQLVSLGKTFVEHKLTRAVLGNLYSYSLTKIGAQISEAEKGNLIHAGLSVKQYIDNAQARAAAKVKSNGNLGNLYKNTIANN